MDKLYSDYKNMVTKITKSLSKAKRINPALEKEFMDISDNLVDFTGKIKEIEKLAVLGKIISATCHELRNPLSAINTSIYFIQSNLGKDKPKLIKHTDIIQREVDSTTRILDALFLFYKFPEPSLISTSVNALIEGILSDIEIRMPKKRVNIRKGLDPSIPKAMIDIDQLGKVIENILQNAYDSIGERGEIRVGTKSVKDKIQISISDNGCGIPEGNMEKIFDPDFSTKSRGIGLGLALVKDIIERHGGSVEVKSKIKRGTMVTVTIPIKHSRNNL